ncbi:MAG TPA: response regulator transcription factor [Halanaerobiales bacterium]|nr:response regulator transcription factor [Halanaerobiales bacterium]
MSKILIVEDEKKIARIMELEITHEGYEAEVVYNGKDGIEELKNDDYDLLILDIMLPGLDGIEVCNRIRKFSEIPIIMVTAKDSTRDKVKGLDTGADDYITKPFEAEELMARIRAQLRREKDNEKNAEKNILKIDDLVMDKDKYTVSREGDNIELTKKEYDLLKYFLENKDIVLSRDQLLEAVWGYDYVGQTNIVDVYIRYLRSKIDDPYDKKLIKTVRGVGYVIRDEENV